MAFALTTRDETTAGSSTAGPTLEFPVERVTVREIIRARVYQEVQDYNRSKGDTFRGLVQPSEAEVALNGYKMKARREVDWKQQFAKACEAYEKMRVLVLAGDKQTGSLDEEIELTRGVEVTFLRLVPLVGG
jgi:hypothetical protein